LPAAPSAQWLAQDKKGRLTLIWRMSKWYTDELKRSGDPQATNEKFLNRWGLNNFLVIQPKSEAKIPAAPVTTDASKWARAHPDIAEDFPHVYGLFAPTSGDFDQTAYERQFERGERAELTPGEMLRLANARLAQTAYANERAQYPDQPNDEQAAYLRRLRKQLGEEFPGYGDTEIDFTKTDRLIVELEDAANDPRLRRTQAGVALRQYLARRNDAIAQAEADGLASPWDAKRAQPLRDWLNEWGEEYADKYPAFVPMWDRVFSHEVG
jgi:hypothetical protein